MRTMQASAIAILVALTAVSPATGAGSSWHRLRVWTSRSTALAATHRLPDGTYRLVYRAKIPKSWMYVELQCRTYGTVTTYSVRSRLKEITLRSSGCALQVNVAGHRTPNASGMSMRLELDRSTG